MALSDWYSNIHLLLRWLHVIAGITWVGHLYFFSFVNVPFQNALEDAEKKTVNPKLLPRALWWFRWGAMITFLSGLVLFVMSYMYAPGVGFGATSLFLDAEGVTGRAWWILFGMTLATIMWFSVWFIVWPIQKKILAGRASAAELPALRRRAHLVSRINTYLSGPMLFGMLAPAHYGAINLTTALVAAALGLLAIFWAIRSSSKVGTSI